MLTGPSAKVRTEEQDRELRNASVGLDSGLYETQRQGVEETAKVLDKIYPKSR